MGGNWIAGNQQDGLDIAGGSDNTVAANTIGGAISGVPGNSGDGIAISGGTGNVIGGRAMTSTTTGAISALGVSANVIVGNEGNGISISGYSFTDSDFTGSLTSGSPTITGPSSTAGLVVGQSVTGMGVPSGTTIVSVDSSTDTIALSADATVTGTQTLTVSAATVLGNQISQNSLNGVQVTGNLGGTNAVAEITANFIGTDLTGTTTYNSDGQTLGNGLSGIDLVANSAVSGTLTAVVVSGNVISGNGSSGVTVESGVPGSSAVEAARIAIQDNLIGTDKTGERVSSVAGSLPFGNVLDGIRLPGNVSGVTIGGSISSGTVGLDIASTNGNLISGNLGRGIELDGGVTSTTISNNLIGVGFATSSAPGAGPVYSSLSVIDSNSSGFGNLSDGVFILGASLTTIQNNVISGNRGYGIHAAQVANQATPIANDLTITDNYIGTNQDGTEAVVGGASPSELVGDGQSFGNSADGIFLDTVGNTLAANVQISGNIVSGNHANGIDLLDSSMISIVNNKIGVASSGDSQPGLSTSDFGNASNGVFINQSSEITIGGELDFANIIAGNHSSGVFISGSASSTANSNSITGNYIGMGTDGQGNFAVVPNAVAGIILSNADDNQIGGSDASLRNVISGNSLDGILLVNNAGDNTISNNLIGTDPSGSVAGVANSADGIFLLGSNSLGASIKGVTFNPTPGTISGNTISDNVLSGNNENGIQIFGSHAIKNAVSNNTIGLGTDGITPIANGANGVYLNDAGNGNPASANTIGPGNLISGNAQSGVLIAGTNGGGGDNLVLGNFIGTDKDGATAIPNGGNGILIDGSSSNTIGGAIIGSALGKLNLQTDETSNLISGNAQVGIDIFSPAQSAPAMGNLVIGNEIGTNAAGTMALGNGGDGVAIESGSHNTIGGSGTVDGNVVSANTGIGVLIDESAADNQVLGNRIGTDWTGTSALGNDGDGVQIDDGSDNTIGGSLAADDNVISANGGIGILIDESSAGNLVLGDRIGTDLAGAVALGNGGDGVQIVNSSNNTIGGTTDPDSNVISANAGNGVLIEQYPNATASGNLVHGNFIGTNAAGNAALPNTSNGVELIDGSANTIGGAATGAGNLISGNQQWGISMQITGDLGRIHAVGHPGQYHRSGRVGLLRNRQRRWRDLRQQRLHPVPGSDDWRLRCRGGQHHLGQRQCRHSALRPGDIAYWPEQRDPGEPDRPVRRRERGQSRRRHQRQRDRHPRQQLTRQPDRRPDRRGRQRHLGQQRRGHRGVEFVIKA